MPTDPQILQLTALTILLIGMTQGILWAARLTSLRKNVVGNRLAAQREFSHHLKRIHSRAEHRPSQRAWRGERPFKVSSKKRLSRNTCALTLVPEDGGDIAAFSPGQHVFLSHQPVGQARTVRCYSIINGAHVRDYYRIAVRRIPGVDQADTDGPEGRLSTYLHDELQVGQTVNLKAPGGHFFLNPDLDDQTPIVLLGLDIGILALLSIADTLIARQDKRPLCLAYFSRNEAETLLLEELHALRVASRETLDLRICIGSLASDAPLDSEYSLGQRELSELSHLAQQYSGHDFYVAGYTSTVNQACEHLAEAGVPFYALRSEIYKINRGDDRRRSQRRQSSGRLSRTSIDTAVAVQAKAVPKVAFLASDKVVKWLPTCSSLLEFAEAESVPMPSDCRMGSCRTCMTRIVSGDVEYIQPPFNEPDEGYCLPCICVPTSELELEI